MSGAATTSGSGGLDRIYDPIEATLPGVQHSVVQMCLFDAVEEFCFRSTYWRQKVSWAMAPGVTWVNLNPVSAQANVASVLSVCTENHMRWSLIPPATLLDMTQSNPAGQALTRTGTALVSCKPNQLVVGSLPGFLIDDWSEALRDGALFRLHAQMAKPYTDPQRAEFHGRRFRNQISLAREQAHRFRDYPDWAYPYFAHGRRGWAGSGFGCGGASPVPPVGTLPTLAISAGVITTVGTPTGPLASPGVTTLTFAPGLVGAAETMTVTVSNTGASDLVISGVSATGDFAVVSVT